MMWVVLGASVAFLALIGLVVWYARGDARKGADQDASRQSAKVLSIMAKPDDSADSLAELRRRYDARQRRKRLRDPED